jgi:hypothetical protein
MHPQVGEYAGAAMPMIFRLKAEATGPADGGSHGFPGAASNESRHSLRNRS